MPSCQVLVVLGFNSWTVECRSPSRARSSMVSAADGAGNASGAAVIWLGVVLSMWEIVAGFFRWWWLD